MVRINIGFSKDGIESLDKACVSWVRGPCAEAGATAHRTAPCHLAFARDSTGCLVMVCALFDVSSCEAFKSRSFTCALLSRNSRGVRTYKLEHKSDSAERTPPYM